jgi:hypothetical protein
MGRANGIDIWPIGRDVEQSAWVESCSLKPLERIKPKHLTQYRNLDRYESDRVGFIWGSFADEQLDLSQNGVELQSQDLIAFLTTLYQVPEFARHRQLENAKKYLKPDGVIYIQDFAKLESDDATMLDFPEHQFEEKFGYRGFVFENAHPERGFQEVWRFSNGRCAAITVNLGAACLGQFLR